MWTVVYIARNRTKAEVLKNVLCQEGLLAKIRPLVANADDGIHEIIVPESEAQEAQEILCQQSV